MFDGRTAVTEGLTPAPLPAAGLRAAQEEQ